jgi:MFS transporter, DHA3 family, macrolide efflux protein
MPSQASGETQGMSARAVDRGVRAFGLIWFGQLISALGSGLTAFGLSVWVYRRTGSVTRFAQVPLFTVLPRILLSPLAGVAADRYSRRALMIASDLGAAALSLALAVLLGLGRLATWQIYLVVLVTSVFTVFRWPAYTSSIALLVPKRWFGRANGMTQLAQAAASLLAPALAGVLLARIALRGIVLLDLGSFLFAVLMMLAVSIPRPPAAADVHRRSISGEALAAWSWLRQRRGLVQLLAFFAVSNFLIGLGGVLFTPLVLSFASPAGLGAVVSVGGCGLLAGSLYMSATGGPRRRVAGVLGFGVLSGLSMILAGLRPALPLVAAAALLMTLGLPVVNGCAEAIFQSKVPPAMQGRVFSYVRMIAQSASPLAFLAAGPLADRLFEPGMAPGRPLAAVAGALLGTGRGRGIALLYVVTGTISLAATGWGLLAPRLRLLEREVPDAVGEGDAASPAVAPGEGPAAPAAAQAMLDPS